MIVITHLSNGDQRLGVLLDFIYSNPFLVLVTTLYRGQVFVVVVFFNDTGMKRG